MIFNSFVFLLFIFLFFSFWKLANKKDKSRWIYITIASFVFYGWWDWRFLFLIIGSGLIDFFAGKAIVKFPNYRKHFFILSLLGNIGSLAVFKYSSFFASIIDRGFFAAGIQINLQEQIPEFALIVPVGISFYTFQSMSYTIDIYRNRLSPVKNVFHFFAYLSMFPQLVAGPIIRAKDILGQLLQERKANAIQIWHGTKLVAYGFFQKTAIADNLSTIVNDAFSGKASFSSSEFWWITMLCFAFQIYFDFSGYSLIARGTAKWMGYHFKMNFNHPYLATSMKDFWSRWHISLSAWFRDYVYIPLGGSKNGKLNAHKNMWVTMIISGLWHGASFTFIIWGMVHAFFLSVERIFNGAKTFPKNRISDLLMFVLVLFQVLLAWVFFRANDVQQAIHIVGTLFLFTTESGIFSVYTAAILFLCLGILSELTYYLKCKSERVKNISKINWVEVFTVSFCVFSSIYFRGPEAAFIYFQF